jgi:Icc protein
VTFDVRPSARPVSDGVSGGRVGLAHLSDPHITVGPLGSQPAARLHEALGRVLGLDPVPAAVLITGDLVDSGRPEEYEALAAILHRFPIPVHLVAGNHDERSAYLAAFAGTRYLNGEDRTYYTVDHPGFRIIALDSTVPGSPAGRLGEAQLAWLDTALSARTEVPTFIALHHPPIAVGIDLLDGMRLDDGAALAEVVRAHGQVSRVLAGHVHRPITVAFAGTVLSIAPSTYRQTSLTSRADQLIGYVDEPTAFLLHLLPSGAEGPCVTHVVQSSHAGGLLGGF